MMNTVKHLQYQEAKEFQEQTSRFVGFHTFILMSFQRAGFMCGLKQGKFELTIVFFLSFFFYFVYWLFQKFVWFLTKVLEIKKKYVKEHFFFNPLITCTAESHF